MWRNRTLYFMKQFLSQISFEFSTFAAWSLNTSWKLAKKVIPKEIAVVYKL